MRLEYFEMIDRVVAFDRAFHGRTLLTMSLTSKVVPYKRGFGPFAPEIHRAPAPHRGLGSDEAIAALDLFPHPSDAFQRVGAVAGHSVGEIAAAAGARVITAEQAMVLVRERGKAMADAAAQAPTGMTAVLGGDREEPQHQRARIGPRL